MERAILTKGLVKEFGSFRALDGLDLEVRKGEVYGLLGPNGAGKTTAIRVLTGLLRKSGGDAEILGAAVPSKENAANIGYMPQDTSLYMGLTVHQNMEFFGKLYGMDRARILEREAELLRFIDLEKWRDALVSTLSGGMKHRVSLACTLVHEPKVLFLDEPTVGVDPELRVSFWEYFGKLKESGTTILITTHYMDEAGHCDRVGFMRHGRLIAEGRPGDVLREAATGSLEDAFLFFARRADA
jgi:ABC-2 type transport system ATP-binding protein